MNPYTDILIKEETISKEEVLQKMETPGSKPFLEHIDGIIGKFTSKELACVWVSPEFYTLLLRDVNGMDEYMFPITNDGWIAVRGVTVKTQTVVPHIIVEKVSK